MASQERLDESAERPEVSPVSSISNQTLGSQDGGHALRNNEADGGEKGFDGGLPQPVGFWDKSLSKTRLQVFGLWARIGQFSNPPVLICAKLITCLK